MVNWQRFLQPEQNQDDSAKNRQFVLESSLPVSVVSEHFKNGEAGFIQTENTLDILLREHINKNEMLLLTSCENRSYSFPQSDLLRLISSADVR